MIPKKARTNNDIKRSPIPSFINFLEKNKFYFK